MKLLLALLPLLALLSLSACSDSAVPVSGSISSSAPFPSSPSETAPLPEPEPVEPAVPLESQIASITPVLESKILEKREQNSDTVGWLIVPGTTIDDAVLLNPPKNNDYYTTHNFAKEPDKNGAYGMDYRSDPGGAATRDALPRNTPLYAHNHDDNPDGILFAQLKKYKDPAYAKTHPYLFFSTAEEDMAWEVFAVYDATTDLPYIQPGDFWHTFSPLLDVIYAASLYDYGVTITEADKLLTLSTCTFSVAGQEAMPITETNKYRFVVMARLAGPEERIKDEAVFTVNDAPLPPDELTERMTRDYFMLGGLELHNTWTFFDGNDSVEPIHHDALVFVGRIERSGTDEPKSDWEATQLPAGTAIYQDPDYTDVFVASIDGAMIPYFSPVWQDRELYSVRYIHQTREGIIKEITLEADQTDFDATEEQHSRFIDMVHFTPLPDKPDSITQHEPREEIRIGAKNSLSTFYQTFYIGTPASLGREVMVIEQQDGCYYGDAGLFTELKNAMYALRPD